MTTTRKVIAAIVIVITVGSGLAFATGGINPREAVEYYAGHTHEGEETIGAPSHSGGTDRYGCHNGSVPYHCH